MYLFAFIFEVNMILPVVAKCSRSTVHPTCWHISSTFSHHVDQSPPATQPSDGVRIISSILSSDDDVTANVTRGPRIHQPVMAPRVMSIISRREKSWDVSHTEDLSLLISHADRDE